MAITRKTQPRDSLKDFREAIQPFIDNESGIKALQGLIEKDNYITRGGMYLLEILNNLISSTNGTKNLYQRIPPEVRGGLHDGGRRNVQASLIQRAVCTPVSPEQGGGDEVCESGYTRLQEIIGHWAEKDGSWSDTPESDIKKKGYSNNPDIDGSEARVFFKENSPRVMKTIDCSHFTKADIFGDPQAAFELQIDRINIYNATHPHTALQIEGFGMREDSTDNRGFVVIVSQQKIEGRKPSFEEITEAMEKRGYELSSNKRFFVSKLDNTILWDVNEWNCVKSPQGNIMVFDCDAGLKLFPVEPEKPKKISIEKLLPSKGKFDNDAWASIFGDTAADLTDNAKSSIVKHLRLEGQLSSPVEGKLVFMENAAVVPLRTPDGRTIPTYTGEVLVGEPKAFRKEHTYSIPELNYSPSAVESINRTIQALQPYEGITVNEFLNDPRFVGEVTASFRDGGYDRRQLREELRTTGRLNGLVNGRWHVQLDPSDQNRVLINDAENIRFMLWPNDTPFNGEDPLTSVEKLKLMHGQSIDRGGVSYFFNTDIGRVDSCIDFQRKLKLKAPVEKNNQQQRRSTKTTLSI